MKYFGYIIFAFCGMCRAEIGKVLESSHGLPGAKYTGGGSESDLIRFLSRIIAILQDIVAIVAVLGICIVGVLLIMSQGNEEKAGDAKKYISSIIVGVVIAFTAWSMIALVNLIPGSLL